MNRSGVQLTIAPVLAALPSFQSANSVRGGSVAPLAARGVGAATPAARPGQGLTGTQQQSRTATQADPNALRNITNLPHAGRRIGGAESLGKLPHASLSASTHNLPLASHEKRRYGFAATQQREVEQHMLNAQRAYNPNSASTQASQAAARGTQQRSKRKMTQNY